MKKNLFAIFAFAGLAFTACVKPIDAPNQESKEPVFSLFVSGLETKAETKAGYKDGEGVLWSNLTIGEYEEIESPIGLISASNHYQSSTVTVFDESGTEKDQGYKVSFGFDSAPASGQYIAYQPYNVGSTNNAIKFTVAPEQRQNAAGTMDVHDGSRLPCVSTGLVEVSESATSEETSFKATAAILRFFIYDPEIEDGSIEKIYSVKFKANNPVAGTITCQNDGTQTGGVADGGNEVQVKLTTLAPIKKNVNEPVGMGIYLVALPCTTNGYTYEVETVTGRYIFTSTREKVLEAGKIYDVKLNLQKNTDYERRAPYFVGATTPAHWTVPGEPNDGGPIPMNPVEDLDGVFTLDVDWGNNGADFKFLAFNDRWDYAYLSHDTQEEYTYNFNKECVRGPEIKLTEKVVKDNKWYVTGYGCTTSVTYVFDANANCIYCLPQLYLIGGKNDTSVGWTNASWDFGETTYQNNKLTLDYKNKCLSVTKANVWNNLDFKIVSRHKSTWNDGDGIWLRRLDGSKDDNHAWFTDTVRECQIDVRQEGENQAGWLINAADNAHFHNKSITLQLDIEKWNYQDGSWKLKIVEN